MSSWNLSTAWHWILCFKKPWTTLPIRSAFSTGSSRPSFSSSKLDCSWPNHFNFFPYFWIIPKIFISRGPNIGNSLNCPVREPRPRDPSYLMNLLRFLQHRRSCLTLCYPKGKIISAFPLAFFSQNRFLKFWIKIKLLNWIWIEIGAIKNTWCLLAESCTDLLIVSHFSAKLWKCTFALNFDSFQGWSKYFSKFKSISSLLL